MSEYDRETSIMRTPWPTRGYYSLEKKVSFRISDQPSSFAFVLNDKNFVSLCVCVCVCVFILGE